MYVNLKSVLSALALAALLALSPARATEILFDNGEAIDNAGLPGGTGYENNALKGWQVYDNFNFALDATIESVRFQMAGGTEPFRFSVYADDAGKPGTEIYSIELNAGEYSFSNFREYLNGINPPDAGYDFSFDLAVPLTLSPGDYWISFHGIGTSLFYTLGAGPGDGFLQKNLARGDISNRRGDTPFQLIGQMVGDTTAVIDIKPGSDVNPINPRSNGVIPVAVLGSIDFDATLIDVTSVVFGPGSATPAHDGHVEDVNDDGFMDMLLHFRTRQTGIECGDTEAFLSGQVFGGETFSNFDSITTVGCGDTDSSDDDTNDDNVIMDGDDSDDNGDAGGEGGGGGGSALDWAMLPGLGALWLLGFYRRRIPGQ